MFAAIDAGSNTLRLLIGKVVAGKVAPELYLRRICRLAGGFTVEEGLSLAARERTLFALTAMNWQSRALEAIAVQSRFACALNWAQSFGIWSQQTGGSVRSASANPFAPRSLVGALLSGFLIQQVVNRFRHANAYTNNKWKKAKTIKT